MPLRPQRRALFGIAIGALPRGEGSLTILTGELISAMDPAPAGPLEVCVVADDDGAGGGALNECNEANNNCCARLPLICECVDTLVARPKSGKIQLVWQPVGTLGYNVYRGTISGGPYLKIASTESSYSTYLDSPVVNGTKYYYVVRPVAVTGDEVCQSNEASATASTRLR